MEDNIFDRFDCIDFGAALSFGWTSQYLDLKTQTRREWKDSHATKYINAFNRAAADEKYVRVPALDTGYHNKGKQIGWCILTQCPYKESVNSMGYVDLFAEGGMCTTSEEFIRKYFGGNDELEVWVINFIFVPLPDCQLEFVPKLERPFYAAAVARMAEDVANFGAVPDLKHHEECAPTGGVMFGEKTEEMLTGWDLDEKYKYLCFYHKAFPFMNDSWGFDCSDSKEELLEKQWPLFSPRDISEQAVFNETFRLVLNAIASDPQLLLCSDGEYRICRYSGSKWDWVGTPVRFTKDLWKKLSSQYRKCRNSGYRMHRMHMIVLDDVQFATAQRLIRQVFDDEIATHEIKDEF